MNRRDYRKDMKNKEEFSRPVFDRNPYWSLDATVLKPALQAFFIAMSVGGFILSLYMLIAYLRNDLTLRQAGLGVLLGCLAFFCVYAVYLWIAFSDWNRFLYTMEKTFQVDINRDKVIGQPEEMTIKEEHFSQPDHKSPIGSKPHDRFRPVPRKENKEDEHSDR